MRADRPFRKSLVCAAVLFVVLFSIVAIGDAKGLSRYTIVFSFLCGLIALATGAWGHFSKKTWSWGRFAATVAGFFMAYVLVIVVMIVVAMVMNEP